MKFIILFLLITSAAFCSEWHNQKLPMADESKPVYQPIIPGLFGVGGLWGAVRIPTAQDYDDIIKYERKKAENAQRIKDLESASRWIKIGIVVFLIGMVGHAMNSLKILDRITEYVMAGGVLSIVTGIIFRWMITNEKLLLYIVVLPLIISGIVAAILSRPCVKQWSVSRGWTWFRNRKSDLDKLVEELESIEKDED